MRLRRRIYGRYSFDTTKQRNADIYLLTSGQFFVPLAKLDQPSKLALDDKLAKELWDFSEAVVKEKLGSLS